MKKTDFDEYAENYHAVSVTSNRLKRFFSWDSNYFAECRLRLIKKHTGIHPRRVLEYGCGTGDNLGPLTAGFPDAEVSGCDISEKSLEQAAKANPSVALSSLNTGDPYAPGHFDLVLLSNVLHHLDAPSQRECLSNINRRLKQGGELFIFEHNPYNPITRRLVRVCPFDRDAVLLRPSELAGLLRETGLEPLDIRYFLLFPALLKRLRPLEGLFSGLPLGGQYYIRAVKP